MVALPNFANTSLVCHCRLRGSRGAVVTMSLMSELVIRPSVPSDVVPVSLIYSHHVMHGTATFELTPPTSGEIARRRDTVLDAGLPYLVAEYGGVWPGMPMRVCTAHAQPTGTPSKTPSTFIRTICAKASDAVSWPSSSGSANSEPGAR